MSLAPKRMLRLAAIAGIALIPVVSHAQAKAARKDARTEIAALNAKNTTAYNAGHPETMAQAYAPDAVVMPPNGTPVRGAKAIAEWWGGGFKMGLRNLTLTTTDVYAQGNLATETGTYSLDMPMTEGGAPMHDSGKYMVLWKRSPTAGWQLFRDIFNSDAPMPQMAEGMKGEGMKDEMKHDMAGMSDSVLMSVNPIRADRRADFEQWAKEFWNAGMKSSDPRVKRQFMGAHVITPSVANADGTWSYVLVAHPYFPGEDYMISSLTGKLFAASDTTRLNGLLAGARAAPPTVIRGTMTMNGPMMKH